MIEPRKLPRRGKQTPSESPAEASPPSGLGGTPSLSSLGTAGELAGGPSEAALASSSSPVVHEETPIAKLLRECIEHCAIRSDAEEKLSYEVSEALRAGGHDAAGIRKLADARREELIREAAQAVVEHEHDAAGVDWRALRKEWHQATLQMLPTDPRLRDLERAYLRAHRADQPRHRAHGRLLDLCRCAVRSGESKLRGRLRDSNTHLKMFLDRALWLRGQLEGSQPWAVSPATQAELAAAEHEITQAELDIAALEGRLARREQAAADKAEAAIAAARRKHQSAGSSSPR